MTRYFYRNADKFRIHNFRSGHSWSTIQLSVDTPEDRDTFIEILSRMSSPHWEYGLNEIMELFRRAA